MCFELEHYCNFKVSNEQCHERANILHNAKTRTQIGFVVTAKLIGALVFATQIVQYLFFLNLKFQASGYLLWLCSLVCVGLGSKPECWFSHVVAQMFLLVVLRVIFVVFVVLFETITFKIIKICNTNRQLAT